MVICLLSFFILVFGLVSNFIKETLFLSEPIVSMLFGIIIGPYFLDIMNVSYTESKIIMFQFARVVLCIQIMTAAMSLPQGYIFKKYKSLCVLLFVVSFVKYFISFIIVYYTSQYNAQVSWVIAACLTPTDPILSSSIVKSHFADENVPERLRHLLSAESGINDGIGLILLYLPLDLLFTDNINVGVYNFFVKTICYNCLFPAILGMIIGYISRISLKGCYSNDLVGIESFLVYGIALTFFVLGLMEKLQASELICIFFTGTIFAWDEWFVLETRESRLQEVTDSFFSSSFFVFFGSRIDFSRMSPSIIFASILIIFLRRTIPVYIFKKWIPEIKNVKEAIFIGWFGPIGVGALFYALMADKILNTITIEYVSVVVLFSVIIHGLTIPLFKLSSVQNEPKMTGFHLPRRIYTAEVEDSVSFLG